MDTETKRQQEKRQAEDIKKRLEFLTNVFKEYQNDERHKLWKELVFGMAGKYKDDAVFNLNKGDTLSATQDAAKADAINGLLNYDKQCQEKLREVNQILEKYKQQESK